MEHEYRPTSREVALEAALKLSQTRLHAGVLLKGLQPTAESIISDARQIEAYLNEPINSPSHGHHTHA